MKTFYELTRGWQWRRIKATLGKKFEGINQVVDQARERGEDPRDVMQDLCFLTNPYFGIYKPKQK